ncbi:MAG: MarR family transcriptional regulator [Chloroflexi bacterium CFX7]|nr:MAG: MarR family transcriptional regulator [bacterium]MCE7928460.1 MarR family transcriptional regulator [Chloroflexi bacterium CFX7]
MFLASGLLDPVRLSIWDREGLTVTQLRLLVFLSEEGGLSNAELADRLLVTRPSVSALLERLERGGFIRREVALHDRRGIRIWLEERGRQAVETSLAEAGEFGRELLGELSDPDLEELTATLTRFVERGRARRAAILNGAPAVRS